MKDYFVKNYCKLFRNFSGVVDISFEKLFHSLLNVFQFEFAPIWAAAKAPHWDKIETDFIFQVSFSYFFNMFSVANMQKYVNIELFD